MPKRSRKPAKSRDANQAAFDTIQQIIARTEGTDGKDPLAVLLGRRGGRKGGRARADGMTPAQRSKSAKKAALARWGSSDK
jgi:hypothetical protein